MGVEQDEALAVELYRQAAQRGYAPAQCNLGFCYYQGIGVEENNDEAFRWFVLIALPQKEAGPGVALPRRLLVEPRGLGVVLGHPDNDEAFRWFAMAAEREFPRAMNLLGECFDQGYGVEQDSAPMCPPS